MNHQDEACEPLAELQAVTYYRMTRFEVTPTAATVVRDEGEWVVIRVAAFKNPIRVKRTSIRKCSGAHNDGN